MADGESLSPAFRFMVNQVASLLPSENDEKFQGVMEEMFAIAKGGNKISAIKFIREKVNNSEALYDYLNKKFPALPTDSNRPANHELGIKPVLGLAYSKRLVELRDHRGV